MNWGGLILIFAGVIGYLAAIGYIPKNPENPETIELWRRKFGRMMKILCPMLIIFGFAKLFALF